MNTSIEQTIRESQNLDEAAYESLSKKANEHGEHADSLKSGDAELRGRAHERAADAHRSAFYSHSEKASHLAAETGSGAFSAAKVAQMHHHIDAAAHHRTKLAHHFNQIYPK